MNSDLHLNATPGDLIPGELRKGLSCQNDSSEAYGRLQPLRIDRHNPYYISFLGLAWRVGTESTSVGACEMGTLRPTELNST